MTRLGALPRLVLTIAALLVAAVAAMHALAMPPHPAMALMTSHASASAMLSHAGISPTSANHPMSACASAHCAAARGGDPVAAQAMPTPVFALSTIAASSRLSVADTAATASRAPPRSGSSSWLCVWRQ